MTAPQTPDITWRASSDRIAHASTPRATRTLCGVLVTIQRLAWPEQERCTTCDVLQRAGAVR